MSIKSLVKQVLVGKENRQYEKLLNDRRVTYAEWMAEQERQQEQEHQAEQARGTELPAQECPAAECEFVLIIASEGRLAENAVQKIAGFFAANPQVQVVYGDEDVWKAEEGNTKGGRKRVQGAEAGRCLPWFKPDWSLALFRQCFYFGSLVAMRKELFVEQAAAFFEISPREVPEKIVWEDLGFWPGEDSFREQKVPVIHEKDWLAYYDWLCLTMDRAGVYRKGNRVVGHIPEILFHCENESEQMKHVGRLAGKEMDKPSRTAADSYITGSYSLSVVIPSKDNPEMLKRCVRKCVAHAVPFQKLEIVIVDNGSSPENRKRIEDFAESFRPDEFAEVPRYLFARDELPEMEVRISYLYQPMEFNFSKMCNLGAARATGTYLLFLNDDVEMCQPLCLAEMALAALAPLAGAVGLKLLYPDSNRIQHVGITNLPMGPVHKLQFKDDSEMYYYGANRMWRNCLAVTAACLMIRRKRFREVGGFDEELAVAFNDVEFCFRLYKAGYHNICVNNRFAYHHESLSRGADESEEKLARLLRERDKLYERHPDLEGVDPYYSEFLNRDGLDTSIRPAYVTAGNCVQRAEGKLEAKDLAGHRQDECLMVRIEDCRSSGAAGCVILGYGVVLGDNNACYEKELLLKREGTVFSLKLAGQYRPDLQENMPDQVNVALSGFRVEIGAGAVPAGRYRLGMAARNRVTGLKLINWSNRYTELK